MKYYITFFIIIFTTSVESYPKILTIKENSNYLLVNEKSLPIIDINILFNFGSKNDLSQKGITNFSVELLHQQKYKNKKFINTFEEIGAQFSSSVSRESTSISIRFINTEKNLTKISSMLGKMLSNKDISNETFELTKESILKNIKARELDPSSILSYKSNEEYFSNTNLSHPINGYEENIIKISIDDIKQHLISLITQNRIKVSFVGDIDNSQAANFISNLLVDIPNDHKKIVDTELNNLNVASKTINFKHDSEQTHISIMIPAVTREDDDFYNLLVANYIFGGSGFGSMLMTEIREKNGLAYSVFSYLMPYKNVGVLKIGMQTATNNTKKAVSILNNQLSLFEEFDFDEDKIEAAKLGLIRNFALRFDTNKKILNTLSAINDLGMHENYFENYISGIKSVNKIKIQQAIKSKILFNKKLVLTVGKN